MIKHTVSAVLSPQESLNLADCGRDFDNVSAGVEDSTVRKTVVAQPLENKIFRFGRRTNNGINLLHGQVLAVLRIARGGNL